MRPAIASQRQVLWSTRERGRGGRGHWEAIAGRTRWALAILLYKAVYIRHAWGQGLPRLYSAYKGYSYTSLYRYKSLYTIQPLHHPSDPNPNQATSPSPPLTLTLTLTRTLTLTEYSRRQAITSIFLLIDFLAQGEQSAPRLPPPTGPAQCS